MRLEADHEMSVAFEFGANMNTTIFRASPPTAVYRINGTRDTLTEPEHKEDGIDPRLPVPHRVSA
ncbi:MAG: hypothetical protein JNL45_01450 [Hyphomicrobium sp.]|jgi:hypothetical protein|nr:hypothetical protein [Hyphomicrobium sp.]